MSDSAEKAASAGTGVRSTTSRISKRSIDDLILGSEGWAEFYAIVAAIGDETDKGDCFERLMQLYMQSAPHMVCALQARLVANSSSWRRENSP